MSFRSAIAWILAGLLIGMPLTATAQSPNVNGNVLKLGIDDYVWLVLKQSDEARSAANQLKNSQISRSVTSRELLAPTLSVGSSVNKQRTDTDSVFVQNEAAEAQATVAQPLFLSGGRLSATYSNSTLRSETNFNVVTHTNERPSYTASVSQPLFLFVGNTDLRQWKRARIGYDIAVEGYRRELQSIENSARARYYDLLLKAAQLDVEKTKSLASRRSHEITKALVAAGRLPGIELSRSKLRLQQDLRRLSNAETVLRQAINDALQAASLKLDYEVQLTSRLSYTPVPMDLDSLITQALENRQDYRSAKQQLELSKLDLQSTMEANNPNISAVASLSKSDTSTGAPPDTHTKSWSGGLTMNWSLFDAGITRLRTQSERNSIENQTIALAGLERSIRTDVTNAYLELKRTEEQLEDLKESTQQARQSVEAVRIRYQNGRDRLIDVFDSEQQLRDLELENLQVVVDANLARDRLNFLVGKSLDPAAKP